MIGNTDNTTQLKEPVYQLCVSAYPHICANQFWTKFTVKKTNTQDNNINYISNPFNNSIVFYF